MKRILAAVLAAIFLFAVLADLFVLTGCAHKYSIPKKDLEFVDSLGKAKMAKFIEHYQTLFREQRPPTAEEFGYWTATYEQVVDLYRMIKSRLEDQSIDFASFADLLKRAINVLFAL